jgi:hypothetical protein
MSFSESGVQSWLPNVFKASDFLSGAQFHGVKSGVKDLAKKTTSEQVHSTLNVSMWCFVIWYLIKLLLRWVQII